MFWAFRRSKAAPSGHSLIVLGGFVPQPPAGYPLLSLTRHPVRQHRSIPYLRKTMARKTKPANAVKARTRAVAKSKVRSVRRKTKKTTANKVDRPPQKLFDADKWCGVLPELAGDSLTIQRKLRDEW